MIERFCGSRPALKVASCIRTALGEDRDAWACVSAPKSHALCSLCQLSAPHQGVHTLVRSITNKTRLYSSGPFVTVAYGAGALQLYGCHRPKATDGEMDSYLR
jgi:hypothetical protein